MRVTRKRYRLRLINPSIQAFIALALGALVMLTVVAQRLVARPRAPMWINGRGHAERTGARQRDLRISERSDSIIIKLRIKYA